jgi:hypothetical protein
MCEHIYMYIVFLCIYVHNVCVIYEYYVSGQ